MQKDILWIDDIRTPDVTLNADIARTYNDAISLLIEHEYNTVYLDHDLADYDDLGYERTGYTIVKWLVDRKLDGDYTPPNYEYLTANPIGKANMQSLIDAVLTNDNY
jgi:hypothetical protein